MKPVFRFYTEADEPAIHELILAGYRTGTPIWGVSRHAFCRGLHPDFIGVKTCNRRTAGLWFEENRAVACAISEGAFDGDAFFLFRDEQTREDEALLARMLDHATTHMSCFDDASGERRLFLRMPPEAKALPPLAEARGFAATQDVERCRVMPFAEGPYPITLPEGYRMIDGHDAPDFFPANVHMFAFNYGKPGADTGEAAFHRLRQMPSYRPELDLYVIDPEGRPVAMAIIWFAEGMPICELEPLGVAWWCRRMGLGKALIYEAANRVMARWPACRGMLGGDQPFYDALGYVTASETYIWQWQQQVRAPRK